MPRNHGLFWTWVSLMCSEWYTIPIISSNDGQFPVMDEVECCWHLYWDNGQRVIGMHVGFSGILASPCWYIYQNLCAVIVIIEPVSSRYIMVHCDTAYHCRCSLVSECKGCVCTVAGRYVGLLETWFSWAMALGENLFLNLEVRVHNQPCGTCWTAEGQMGDGRDEQGRKWWCWLYASNMYYKCPPRLAVKIFCHSQQLTPEVTSEKRNCCCILSKCHLLKCSV